MKKRQNTTFEIFKDAGNTFDRLGTKGINGAHPHIIFYASSPWGWTAGNFWRNIKGYFGKGPLSLIYIVTASTLPDDADLGEIYPFLSGCRLKPLSDECFDDIIGRNLFVFMENS